MTSILADRQYTLNDYKHQEQLHISNELHPDIIEKINRIAKRVGAPSYQKTPVFKRNHYHKGPSINHVTLDFQNFGFYPPP